MYKIKLWLLRLLNNKYYPIFPRASTTFMKRYTKGKPLVICEIGFQYGHNARSILKELNVKTFYSIDNTFMSEYFIKDGRMKYIHESSHTAHKHIKEELDFCYIDGAHDYKTVWSDINLYFGLLRPGGVLAGHDVNYTGNQVLRAVIEFIIINQIQPEKLQIDNNDWWFIK